MSNVFTVNPIKINIINISNTIKKTVVFIGIVPKLVEKELQKIELNNGKYNKNNIILKNYYGSDWVAKLGIIEKKTGGDDFSYDDTTLDAMKDTIDIDNLNDAKDTIDIDNLNDINAADTDNLYDPININLDDLDDKIVNNSDPISIDDNSKINFIFDKPLISIYPEDKIIEFKKKLYVTLKIPMYRQHLWYIYQGRSYPLNYTIYDNTNPIYINIQSILNKLNDNSDTDKKLIEGIPIDNKYYAKKSELKVIAYDTFSILGEYYYKYGITEYYLLDLDDFINPIRPALINIIKDRYQLELIYYSFILLYWPMITLPVFIDYIKSDDNISKIYPILQPNINDMTLIYKLEKKIIDEKIDLINNPKKKIQYDEVKSTLKNSIVKSTISVLKYQNSKESVIFLRNLFDLFQLNNKVINCKCSINNNNHKFILNKSYKTYPFIKDNISDNSIIFKIKVDDDSYKTITFVLFINGNYNINAEWSDENQHDFDNIFKICSKLIKPVIDTINGLDSLVLINKKKIPMMNKTNSKFTEIGINLLYKKTMNPDQFDLLNNILNDFKKAGITNMNQNINNIIEYYFSKGMYQFQADRIERLVNTNNYYEFLTNGVVNQKWIYIFEKTRNMKIHHRFSDIKIEISGIKEKEFTTFYDFIITLFYLYEKSCIEYKCADGNNIKLNNIRSSTKSIRNLKEQDPVLYNFKKLYKTKKTYSKICQKKHQPVLLDKTGYEALSGNLKKNAVKYWNFTENTDAYYSCPNPKFPYIKFLVKKHPKDYCIPCCVISKMDENIKGLKKEVYDACINNHIYTKEERTITDDSTYIMAYGKDVEPGRLSRLPETTLEPLFYESYSIQSHGIDSECISTDGYYIYGIEQNHKNIQNIGILYIIIHATETTIEDFIKNITNLIKLEPIKYRVILNGSISKYFKNINDFLDSLYTTFISNIVNTNDNIPWNDIFISISYLFLKINMIYFQHEKSNIHFILPEYITNKEQFLSNNFTNILIIQKGNKFFPIYFLNTRVFFKSNLFNKKIFNYNDVIIIIISKLVETYFDNIVKNNISLNINFNIIKNFISDTKYKINKLFINNSNMCYYIHIKSVDNKDIFLPIEFSHFIENNDISVTYDTFLRKKINMSIDTLISFIDTFNNWIAVKSELSGMSIQNVDKKLPLMDRVQPIYPYIKITNWCVLSNIENTVSNDNIVFGFMFNNMNYYFNKIKLSIALKIKDIPVINYIYDPDEINESLYNKSLNVIDKRHKLAGVSIYKTNLYKLVLLEFIYIFNNSQNTEIRRNLKSILTKNIDKDFDIIMNEIRKIVIDYSDQTKIKSQICEFINNHHNKELLISEIDDSFYTFDRHLFDTIKQLPHDKLYKELEKLSKNFVTYGNIDKLKNFDFPNMFIPCQVKLNKSNYCKNNKLIIDKYDLKHILEIVASDILNPIKEKWLFSSILYDNVLNIFKFIRRPNEEIMIEMID